MCCVSLREKTAFDQTYFRNITYIFAVDVDVSTLFAAKAARHNASTPPARNLMGPAQSTQTNSCKFDGASPTPLAKSISTATARPLNNASIQGLVSKDAVERRDRVDPTLHAPKGFDEKGSWPGHQSSQSKVNLELQTS